MMVQVLAAATLLLSLCDESGAYLEVDIRSSTIALCQNRSALEEYRVAIGKGGWGKTRKGDNKTPTGDYPLGLPRTSEKFHLFIPIGYPTAEQQRLGFTGEDIGIHGPHRDYTWLGRLSLLKDWTQGCMAVGKDEDIEEIASWVRKNRARRIVIHDPSPR